MKNHVSDFENISQFVFQSKILKLSIQSPQTVSNFTRREMNDFFNFLNLLQQAQTVEGDQTEEFTATSTDSRR